MNGKINTNSLKSVRIEVLAENTKKSLGWASGFFFKKEKRIFLVTNWHVVSGKNFLTKEFLNSSGAIPGYLNIEFHSARESDEKNHFHHDECIINDLELYDIEDEVIILNKPRFHTHPIFGEKFDIVVLEITDIFKNNDEVNIITYEYEKINSKLHLGVMDDIFVIGYPLDNSITPNKYPIYKGATIASEPDAFEEFPIFYVDSKTKKGMSGSPVIKKSRLDIKDHKNGTALVSSESDDFIGVYSGRDRQESDIYQAELGIVWRYKECLLPIIENILEKKV